MHYIHNRQYCYPSSLLLISVFGFIGMCGECTVLGVWNFIRGHECIIHVFNEIGRLSIAKEIVDESLECLRKGQGLEWPDNLRLQMVSGVMSGSVGIVQHSGVEIFECVCAFVRRPPYHMRWQGWWSMVWFLPPVALLGTWFTFTVVGRMSGRCYDIAFTTGCWKSAKSKGILLRARPSEMEEGGGDKLQVFYSLNYLINFDSIELMPVLNCVCISGIREDPPQCKNGIASSLLLRRLSEDSWRFSGSQQTAPRGFGCPESSLTLMGAFRLINPILDRFSNSAA